MCDANTLQVASTLAKAGGQLGTAFGQAGQMEAQAKATKARGRIAEARVRRSGEKLLGTQRAKFAKAGVRVAGTPMEVMAQTAADIELEALMLRSNAAQEAAALRTGARSVRSAGLIQTGGTLLEGMRKMKPPAPKINLDVGIEGPRTDMVPIEEGLV